MGNYNNHNKIKKIQNNNAKFRASIIMVIFIYLRDIYYN